MDGVGTACRSTCRSSAGSTARQSVEHKQSIHDCSAQERSHKSKCNNENSKGHNVNLYKIIRENGGWDNWIIKPIEKFFSDDIMKVKIRETELIEVYNCDLNMYKAYTSDEEKKEYQKKYYEEYYKICDYCDKKITKNRLDKHIKSKICVNRIKLNKIKKEREELIKSL